MLTYSLFKTQSMLLSATSRKGQPGADLLAVQNTEHVLVSNKQEEPARCWLTACSNHRACSCQQQPERANQMLTYSLFKPQSMLLSGTTGMSQPDADSLAVQNPKHAHVINKQEGPARCWLTFCSETRACSCKQQAGRASQMLTYILFTTQSMLLSATCRKGQPDTDLLSVQNPEHALISNKHERPARCWLTCCSKPRACSCQQQAGRASKMLTYKLFKAQTMLFSATGRKGQPDADLQTVQDPDHAVSATSRKGQSNADLQAVQTPEHALVSNKQEGPARCWLTSCSKPRACSCQWPVGRASQMLTYILLKTQSTLLSATSRNGQPDADLQPVRNPEHALLSNKHEGQARCWLTACSKPRACSCQKQAWRASQVLTYILFKFQSMLLSATSRKGQPDADLQTV